MNKKSKKIYDKAIDYFEKGKINKALEICELELSKSLQNSNMLNLKGLLLYEKGDLNEAITVWTINKDINKNVIAQNYIRNAQGDKKRLELYKDGEKALKQLKIDKALELFKTCSESDFNGIKVNTGLGLCYQKKGNFLKAKEYIDKALKLDENAITANVVKKELEEANLYYEAKKSSKKVIIILVILFIIAGIGISSYLIIEKKQIKNKMIEEHQNNNEPQIEKNIESSSEIKSEQNNKDVPNLKTFDKEKMKALIENNDLDGIYDEVDNVKEESLSDDNKEIYKQAINLLKSDGVSKFYEYGLWYFNQENYDNAKNQLDKAYKYCEGNSLKEHIIFYRASTASNQSDSKSALSRYKEYYNQYPNGAYIEGVLYELSLLSNSENKEESKKYANELVTKYPNSVYVNNQIKDIMNN
ncbi:tetratricopeptide repeat protein [Clostridium saccharobutylicum]|uniref:tetratricopeptide repeat protein n=1 Tax=Clostridium saccharobutylicum TaxID=169679 RepID=UPI000984050B|nr:tetratricopeptide repeat protein [Clostridium saccharobutylicum]AQS08197.1 tetratricopeptide repeat protein [Clostridium saccharobutylicum]MBC2435916.1 tetratricopeptide repeat protein [Clostridium saccharobutylicum]NSB89018.1 tetratricopeptide (TPR) repeat protein [Clostridium saccharobutylicum]NYC29481.1 tetratricopeptide (TPR) repeat protein [Clostridium saccharobutylicum]OOM11510.1 tetratricopeptide repeat protein [Clostridium saccharobutylicum]